MRNLSNLTQPTICLLVSKMDISHGVASIAITSGIPITSSFYALNSPLSERQRLKTAASTILNAHELLKQDTILIIERVSNLFSDSDVWPSRRTAFYLGISPCLVPPHHWHTGSDMHS